MKISPHYRTDSRPKGLSIGGIVYIFSCCLLGAYFIFAAIQGNYGVLHKVQIETETRLLRAEKDRLIAETAKITNLTHRLSNIYMDMELLDERIRAVLGYAHPNDIIIK